MKVWDRVKIKAPGSGYWTGEITAISDAFRHTFEDGTKAVLRYSQPIATVKAIEGKGDAVVKESDLRREDGVWIEK